MSQAQYFYPFRRQDLAHILHATQMLPRDEPELLGYFYFVARAGTPVHAARAGRVVEAKCNQHLPQNLRSPQGLHQTNLALLQHIDGTYLRYTHVFPEVTVGQEVNACQRIGVIGGGSQEYKSHLHLFSFSISGAERKEIPYQVSLSDSLE